MVGALTWGHAICACIAVCIPIGLLCLTLLFWCHVGETQIWPFGYPLGACIVEVLSLCSAKDVIILSLPVV